ncbi:MAG: TIGR02281 family clan AA aspartic protease, partial [Emcibacteraceae bacterium]|nr:TIGR02281 family clan AA aspartic protease [Emcibacteraceae bacterium]
MGFIAKTFILLGIGYFLFNTFAEDILKYTANEQPTAEIKTQDKISNLVHSVEIPRQRDGHYWVNMDISNNPIAFIIDTGASVVTLSHNDAEKLNLYLSDFDYNITVRTAAGLTTMAEINLDRMTLGVIELYDVKAFVAREGMLSVSLLGMNFLNRLERFEFQDGQLIM